ncbi:MAG: ImmA/IrrE family metallo-endopeptidase [Desulfohalobiaceae bacterium]|nr:ImmA/IrrE family metallo-endopeptidase [Desulfohalobiaceae bacterium]
MVLGIIKDENEYAQALERIEALMAGGLDYAGERELELLGHLVDKYEQENYPIDYPDPISAIKHRMEDLGLRQKDLATIIGSHSKVSEVLSKKRRLSLSMIRALHKHLGIPAEVLLEEEPPGVPDEEPDIDWQRFPLREIVRRGWVTHIQRNVQEHAEEIVRRLYSLAGGQWAPNGPSLVFRQGGYRGRSADAYALQAWLLTIMAKARAFDQYCDQPLGEYRVDHLTQENLSGLVRLSKAGEEGPRLAMNYLAELGIKLVFERHFQRTYLDGACTVLDSETPVIGMTIRNDRIDAFWFTLLHELAHLQLHITSEQRLIFDEDIQNIVDEKEQEASNFAATVIVPEHVWKEHPARISARKVDIEDLARQLDVHPALIAGRVRFERNNYKLLHSMVGYGEIRPFCEQIGLFYPVRNMERI